MALAVVLVALGACGDDTASNAPEEARPPLAPLSARIELDAQTVTIGGTIDGRVVVANNTGENIDVTGCGSIFQVALANEEYEQQVGWNACAEPISIPTGETSYPVTVRAEHLGCSEGRPVSRRHARVRLPVSSWGLRGPALPGLQGQKGAGASACSRPSGQ